MKKRHYGIGIFLLLGIGCLAIANAVDVELYLSIVNSFSGSVNITGNNTINKNNITYIAQTTFPIEIFSDAAGSYSITGDILQPISGLQSQPYRLQTQITPKKANTINEIFPLFRKGVEPLVHPKIEIYVDTLGPTQPIITSPQTNTIRNGNTIIGRTPSIDSGVGISDYIVLLATDQTFSTTIVFQATPNNEFFLRTDSLPEGKLYLKILARDDLQNISESQTIIICNKKSCQSNNPNNGGGGGGGGGSYFNHLSEEKTSTQRITIVENLEEKQKIEIKPEPKIGIISSILYSEELLNAYKYAYSLGVTTIPNAYDANLKGKLIRKDLAKMISEYAIKIEKKRPNNTLLCNFDDIENESLETKYYTKLACKLGLMGREADGQTQSQNFNPYLEVNRAQFGTTLSRTIFGESNNIGSGEKYEWYEKHLLALKNNNIMNKIDTPRTQELRGRVMLTMMRSDPTSRIQHASAK